MKFTIDRGTWRFGGFNLNNKLGRTYLLNEKGFMCCLGQCLLQSQGEEKLLNTPEPCDIGVVDNIEPFTNQGDNTVLSIDAMECNDDFDMDMNERETKLKEIFATHGHEIEFTGEYPSEYREFYDY